MESRLLKYIRVHVTEHHTVIKNNDVGLLYLYGEIP